ncbi:hypothetical protein AA13594_1217 [Gluconacetobacter azotocaptans DSM 13594]|nr:hypothetical protein AA13594_1217 [Gluconacetobacter azotocaptans DSM 13594]
MDAGVNGELLSPIADFHVIIEAETEFPALRPQETTVARVTGLEPATSGVTGRRSNQLSYTREGVRRS